ncbi:MAG TPA: hypothetical protein VF173_11325 [Thermoanaerobaculia bacterium]|nr:hypothetical protein [Thermoanaerobaculia bacterium]
MLAGVQIQNTGGVICTLGVNAVRFDVMPPVRGFVTNSHCTATRSVVDGTVFSQSTSGTTTNRIGVETVDPPFFTAGCPSGRVCRYSDAVFVAYDSETLSARGQIANARFCVPFGGTLEIDPALPRLPVTGITNPSLNTFVEKVGRTTGCTTGFQIKTCIDTNVANSSITMLCQNQVAGVSAPGDSGSPVYRRDGTTALLAGILWGGSSGSYVYSQWFVTSAELGGLVFPEMP